MSNKIGEANIVTRFQDHFTRRIIHQNGLDAEYSFGNFQGIADEKFADCFISTEARCVLIEFKELESEWTAEKRKPLRNDLCSQLIKTDHCAHEARAAQGHFIVWGDLGTGKKNIYSYPKKVCPIFNIKFEFTGESYNESEFIKGIINSKVGLEIGEMNEYVQLMSNLASQYEKSSCPEFKAFLFSYDIDTEDFRTTRFDDLCQLAELMKMGMNRLEKKSSGPKPKLF